ncbi:unnamed protein product [Trichobilharzia szidati]|nr:unnamed protein product [Trichobilharzia szidati]
MILLYKVPHDHLTDRSDGVLLSTMITMEYKLITKINVVFHSIDISYIEKSEYSQSVRTQADGTLCDQVEHSFCSPVFKICLHTDVQSVCSPPLPRNFELIESHQGNSVIWKNASNTVTLSTVIEDQRSMDEATLDIKVFNGDDDEGNIVDRFAYHLTERLSSLRSGKLVTWTNTTQRSIRGLMDLQLSITAIYTPDNDDNNNNKEKMKQRTSKEIQSVDEEPEDYPGWVTSSCFIASSVFRKDVCLKMGIQWRDMTSYEKNFDDYELQIPRLFHIFEQWF